MKRRAFSAVVGGAVVAVSSFARAQKVLPTIGFLHSGTAAQNARRLQGFLKGLSEAGFVDQQNVVIDYRWADGKAERLPEMAADLVKRCRPSTTTASSSRAVA
jgi:putative ABC transport system substrate-binding protein